MTGLEYPPPLRSTRGERILLPICCGHAFPVELTDRDMRLYPLWTRHGIKMGMWGQYTESVASDGSVVAGPGCLTIIETQPFGSVRYGKRANGLNGANIRWEGACGRFKSPRILRYVFFTEGSPINMAKRYRRYAREKGYLVPFAEKVRRNPRLAKGLDLLKGAPNIWYWEIDGDKPGLVRDLKALGFDNILFNYVRRKDLGVWFEPGDVAEIAKIPRVLQSEYDIFTDLIEPDMLDKIDCVRPHWPTEAWDKDDIVREKDGSPRRGWRVRLKEGRNLSKNSQTFPCALLCEARAIPYMRERIGKWMADTPALGARFIDVTGTKVHECYNPKHPLDRFESAEARRKMLAVLGEEFGLVAGTESGLECLNSACDYYEGNFSSSACGSGLNMKVILDEMPESVAKALDPANRVPIWEMVYHDCVVSYWYWGDYNNKYPKYWWKRDLLNAVTGTPPMYLFTREVFEGIRDRLAASVRVTTPMARATADSPMKDYRWLSSDRLVQQSEFENGVKATVNFGEKPFTMKDGYVLPPHGWRYDCSGGERSALGEGLR